MHLKRTIISEKAGLCFVILVAIILRIIPLRLKYLLGYDPYFHLAYIEYIIQHGVTLLFPYAWGPYGVIINKSHPLGFWMVPAEIYQITNRLGVSLLNTFRITPVIFGTLTVLFLYYLIALMYNKPTAFLVSLLLAINFGHIFRSMAGYYRGDNYVLFWYVLYLLALGLLINSEKQNKMMRKLIGIALAVGSLGLSSAVWAAYYVIFVWAILNIITISLWGFIKGDNNGLKISIMLLLLSLVAAIIASSIGNILGYGMLGFNHDLGRRLAIQLGIPLDIPIRDTFLSLYIIYILPTVMVIQIILYLINGKIYSMAKRSGLVALIVTGGLLLMVLKFNILEITKEIFHNQPIREMAQTHFKDWTQAYSLTGFVFPLFFLRFKTKKLELKDILMLETSIVLILMTVIWSRFLFFGSLGISILSGIGLMEVLKNALNLKKERKIVSIIFISLVVVVPVVTGITSLKEVTHLEPFMNSKWEIALRYLGNVSNPNDVVMVWWDHGSWVTYYSKRAPVAELAPNRKVALYYLGILGEDYLEELGVDYVIVSYDTLLQFPAVVKTANQNVSKYAMVVLYPVSSVGNMIIFKNGPYSLALSYSEGKWLTTVNIGGHLLHPSIVSIEKGKSVHSIKRMGDEVYVYVNLNYGYAVLMNKNAFNTTFAKLMFTSNPGDKYHLVYSDGGYIKIYKFVHPNIKVFRKKEEIVLEPTASRGYIFVYIYSPSGKLLFKDKYYLFNKKFVRISQWTDKNNIIKYTYIRNGKILDRGLFRIGDVH